ncbi:disease resistance protein RPS4B-like [Castanea sativa]|uniref:disease resistance protein RPS4B-like n=1 Tax=Castanea sativa TaxID=21020 RepID=UPI003F64B981
MNLSAMLAIPATESIQAIGLTSLDGYPEEAQSFEEYSEAFSKMFNLRLLMIDDLHIPNGLNHVSNSLRHLIWNGYSSKCLSSSFQPKELVKLELHSNNIEHLWKGVKYLDKLKSIDLSDSKFLIRTPDFSGLPRLERLYLIGCHNLVEIHPSIGQLRRLVVLDLESCRSLTNLPSMSTEIESLTILNLCDCINITNIPELKGIMKSLSELSLNKTAVEELPSSIECLTALNFVKSRRPPKSRMPSKQYGYLVTLPASISQLSKLEALDLFNCFKLQSLPELPLTVRYINAEGCYSLQPLPGMPKPSPELLEFLPSLKKRHYYNESNGGVAFKILNCYLQGLLRSKPGYGTSTKKKKEGSRTEFQIIIPAFEIPRWFTYQRVGNSLSINLPPNWCNSRWMGLALCAKLEGYNYLFGLNSNKTFGFRARVMALGGSLLHSQLNSEIVFKVSFGACDIWILYLSRDDWFATFQNGEYNQIKVVFESCGSMEKVRNCGVSLVYEQSVEGFNQTIAQCSRNSVIAFEGWDGDHHDETKLRRFWTFKKELGRYFEIESFVFSLAGNDDFKDPGPSASGSLQSD